MLKRKLRLFTVCQYIFILIFAVSVNAESLTNEPLCNNLYYSITYDNYTLTISGTGEMEDYNGSPWGRSAAFFTETIIENGVTSIGSGFCGGMNNLIAVTIPATVIAIHDNAFVGCEALRDVYYGGSEQSWNEIVFGIGNESLFNATIHYGDKDSVFNFDSLQMPDILDTEDDYAEDNYEEDYAAEDHAEEDYTEGDNAEEDFSEDEDVEIILPEDFDEPVFLDDAVVTKREDWICDEFNTWVEPREYIGTDTVIRIPTELGGKPIDENHFSVHLGEGTHVRGIVFDEGFTKPIAIGGNTEHVSAIRMSSTMTQSEGGGGTSTDFLRRLKFLRTVEVAENNPYYFVEDGILYRKGSDDYTALVWYPPVREDESFYQPDGVTALTGAYYNTIYLKRVENFKGWEYAFRDSSVEEVYCSNEGGNIHYNQFFGKKIKKIFIPAGVKSISPDAFQNLPALEEINVEEGNESYYSDNGVLYMKNTIICYPAARKGEEYRILEGVNDISELCFRDDPRLKNSEERLKYLKRLIVNEGTTTWYVPDRIEIIVE